MSTSMTDPTTSPTTGTAGIERWSTFFVRLLPIAAIAAPALFLIGALFVSAGVETLPGDLDWISEPESLFGFLGAILLTATWVTIGRSVASRAPRAGIAVTVLGVLGAFGAASAFAARHMSIDLVDAGFDANQVNEVWDNPTLFSALASLVALPGFFLAPIVAGIAIARTKSAPVWAGVALLGFVPLFIAAQAASTAIEVTYPAAFVLLLAGALGVVGADRATHSRA